MSNASFNLSLMDVNKFIEDEQLLEVTSPLIREPSSNVFHAQGLFSEQIFGEIGSTNRLVRFGYITLNCNVFHPLIFQNLKSLKALYVEIMAGKTYAIWNEETKDFERSTSEEKGANTGYTFFVSKFRSIEWNKNASIRREDKVDMILNFPNLLMVNKFPVLPAGIRDITLTDGKQEKDEINSIYLSLLNNSKAMPPTASEKPIYDSVHYAIQRKVNEVYLYLIDMLTGKKGFLEGKYGSRAIALGTRNVIASSDMTAASPDDPQYHKVTETKVPLFQAAKALQPLVVYHVKQAFFGTVLSASSDQIPLIDRETLQLVYRPISEEEKDKLLSSTGIGKMIDLFQDADIRFQPVTVKADDKKDYYVFMVYDTGETVRFVRNVESLKSTLKEYNKEFNPAHLRPLTYCELLYVATWLASQNKTGNVTRYPVTDAGSIYASKIHLITTVPGRVVQLVDERFGTIMIPEYPVMNSILCDALLLHPSRLKPLGGDFDGNCLIGSTRVTLRYTNDWLRYQRLADYSQSDQDVNVILDNLKQQTFLQEDGWNYCELKMEDFPANGPYKLDRNGARVFEVIPGCEIMSYDCKCNRASWEPISGYTVEDDCDTVLCSIGGRDVGVSTNESLAVYDEKSDSMIRMSPIDMQPDVSIPVFAVRPLLPEHVHTEQTNRWKVPPITLTDAVSRTPERMLQEDRFNPEVRWVTSRLIKDMGKQRVYDFLVETTKVFVVNEGVVVYDTVNWVPIFSKEANENATSHINSISNYVSPKGELIVGFDDLVQLTWFNMMADPIE